MLASKILLRNCKQLTLFSANMQQYYIPYMSNTIHSQHPLYIIASPTHNLELFE